MQMIDDVFHALLTAGTAGSPDADLTNGQIQVIMNDENLVDRDFIKLNSLNDRFPGIVHIGLRFH